MNYKISVIIPVFNVEKYLKKCMNSVVNQLQDCIQLIVINDGSTDNSQKILNQYKNYKNIQIYETCNQGLSDARNFGIKKSSGEYITFIDSDDFISNDYFNKLLFQIDNDDFDILVFGYCRYSIKSKKNVLINNNNNILDYKPYAWNKLYKRKLFKNVNFPSKTIFEDIPTIYPLLFNNKVKVLNEVLYYYRIDRQDSIMKNKNRDDLKILDVLTILNNKDIPKETLLDINICHIMYRLMEMKNFNNIKYNINLVEKCFSFLNNNFSGWKSNSNYIQIHKKYAFKTYWWLRAVFRR